MADDRFGMEQHRAAYRAQQWRNIRDEAITAMAALGMVALATLLLRWPDARAMGFMRVFLRFAWPLLVLPVAVSLFRIARSHRATVRERRWIRGESSG